MPPEDNLTMGISATLGLFKVETREKTKQSRGIAVNIPWPYDGVAQLSSNLVTRYLSYVYSSSVRDEVMLCTFDSDPLHVNCCQYNCGAISFKWFVLRLKI